MDRVRNVLASIDRMAYQVIRGYADERAAHDLYGRVITRIVFSTWEWLQDERLRRHEPSQFHYARYAEQFAVRVARQDLKTIGRWQRSDKRLSTHELLHKAITSPFS